MKNIKFKELVTDNVFDFCAVLSAIGSEEIIGLFDKEQIEKIQEKSIELKDIGVVMAKKQRYTIPHLCFFFYLYNRYMSCQVYVSMIKYK